MKNKLFTILLLAGSSNIFPQAPINIDSLKKVVISESLLEANKQVEQKFNQLTEELKTQKELNNHQPSHEEIDGLIIAAKKELTDKTDEIIELKLKELKQELLESSIQADNKLKIEIIQLLDERKIAGDEKLEESLNITLDKAVEKSKDNADNKYEELMKVMDDRIHSESEDLIKRINEQNELINLLQKKLGDLEKKSE